MDKVKEQRELLKANFTVLADIETDQKQRLPQPPIQKPVEEDAEIINLPEATKDVLVKSNIFDCLMDRQSVRNYSEESLTLEQLSFLLWTTQRVKKVVGKVNFCNLQASSFWRSKTSF